MPYIPTEAVESSNIKAIGYHRQASTLRIIFHGGRAYDYPMVPEQEYKRLMQAESKGGFFNTRIKPMYGHRSPREAELQPPKPPCCNHPGEACSDKECGQCDDGCCPQEMGRTGQALAGGLEQGQRLIEDARSLAAEGAKDGADLSDQPESAEAEARSHALNAEDDAKACLHPNKEANEGGSVVGCADCGADLSPQDERGDDLIDGVCRCCRMTIQITPEDAVDLCGHCYIGKNGDTNKPCTAHPERRDDCPHGRDGRNCESSCGCACHTGAS